MKEATNQSGLFVGGLFACPMCMSGGPGVGQACSALATSVTIARYGRRASLIATEAAQLVHWICRRAHPDVAGGGARFLRGVAAERDVGRIAAFITAGEVENEEPGHRITLAG